MKLRLVSLACVALALFCAPSRPVAGSALRMAAGLELRAAPDGRFHGRRAAGRRRKLDRLFRHARAIQGAELAPGRRDPCLCPRRHGNLSPAGGGRRDAALVQGGVFGDGRLGRGQGRRPNLRSGLQHEPGQHRRVRPRRGRQVEAGRLQFHRDERGRRDALGLVDGGMRRRDAPHFRELGDTRRRVAADRSPGRDDHSRRLGRNRRVTADSRDERRPARRLVGRYDGNGQRPGDPGRARFRDAEPLSAFQIPERDFRGQILAERRLGQGLLHAEHKGRRQELLLRLARDGPAVHAIQSALHELPGGANVRASRASASSDETTIISPTVRGSLRFRATETIGSRRNFPRPPLPAACNPTRLSPA